MGKQWETTPVKNFPQKITMERIFILHSNHRHSESNMALEEEEEEEEVDYNRNTNFYVKYINICGYIINIFRLDLN